MHYIRLTGSAPLWMSGVVEPSIIVLPLVVRLIVVQSVPTVVADSIFQRCSVINIVRISGDVGLQGVGWSELIAGRLKRLSRRHGGEG